jgi:dTDP-4-amino-4,6-dideoxygalactose transaminase
MILCANPRAQYDAHAEEIDAAMARVLRGGRYILGDEVAAFEKEFAATIGVAHAIGVGSGTDALHLALRAAGIGTGDDVITVSHTAVATVAAVEMAGATPVLVDIDPIHYTIDPARIEDALTERTRAIIPVHLYGGAADLEAVLDIAHRRGLKVIEDCAQSHGASYRGRRTGAIGDAGTFSFYPTKNLGAIGDGGMIVTSDDGIAAAARLLRQYGWEERYVSRVAGWNSRLDELQAAVLRVKLPYLDDDNRRRRGIAAAYTDGLRGTALTLPATRPDSEHAFHLYVVRSAQRDRLARFLQERGVGTLVHYPVPVHLQPAYSARLGSRPLPETERAAREVLSLPMYPELRDDEVQQVIKAIHDFEA